MAGGTTAQETGAAHGTRTGEAGTMTGTQIMTYRKELLGRVGRLEKLCETQSGTLQIATALNDLREFAGTLGQPS